MSKMKYATYQTTPCVSGKGTFYFTDCCHNTMYSVRDEMAYHEKLCPRCFMNGKYVTLYLRGTKEANEVIRKRMDETNGE